MRATHDGVNSHKRVSTVIGKVNTMARTRPARRIGLVLATILLFGVGFHAAVPTPAHAATQKTWLIEPTIVQGTAIQRVITNFSNSPPSGGTPGAFAFNLPGTTVPKLVKQAPAATYLVVTCCTVSNVQTTYTVDRMSPAVYGSSKLVSNSSGQYVEHITISYTRMQTETCDVATSGAQDATCTLPATRFAVGATTSKPAVNTSFSVRLLARDIVNQRVGAYRGTVHFSSSLTMTLPGDYTFTSTDAGAHLFTGLRMPVAGTYTVAARDKPFGLPSGHIVLTAH
jgi:hypothetical protein